MRTRISIYALPILLIIAGGALSAWANQMPRYHDPDWAARFMSVDVTLQNTDALSEEWYAAQDLALTNRDRLFDAGLGIASLGLSILGMLAILGVRNAVDLQAIMTPRTSHIWYLTALAGWFSFVPAAWAYLVYTLERGDYPWWGDTIAIPAAGAVFAAFCGVPIILLGVYLSTRRAILPVRLWARPILGRSWLLGVGALVAAILFAVLLVDGVLANCFMVPSSMIMLYISLSCRASVATARAA